MNKLKLEMKRLLGFKAVSADDAGVHGGANALHRAKIGAKEEVTRQAQIRNWGKAT